MGNKRTAARLATRVGPDGVAQLLEDQPRDQWDAGLIALGFDHLSRSAAGCELTVWHLRAEIASLHAMARNTVDTDRRRIVAVYDHLVAVRCLADGCAGLCPHHAGTAAHGAAVGEPFMRIAISQTAAARMMPPASHSAIDRRGGASQPREAAKASRAMAKNGMAVSAIR